MLIFFFAPDFQATDIKKFTPEKDVEKRYLTQNFMIKSLQFVSSGGWEASTTFYRGLTPEIEPPSNMKMRTPKLSIQILSHCQ